MFLRVIETPAQTEERLKKWEAYLITTGSTEKHDSYESDDSVKTQSGGESDDEMPSTNQTLNNKSNI